MQVASSSKSPVRTAGHGGRLGAYLALLAVGSGVRVFGLASQFVVLVILSRSLSKDTFGDFMTALGFYRLSAMAVGIGASLVLLYHVSRRPEDRPAEVKLHRYSALLSAAAAALIALAGVVLAAPVAHALGKPNLALWLHQLAPFAVFTALLTTSTGALEGRSHISESIALAEAAPNALRIFFLPAVPLFHLPEPWIAHVITLSVLIPWMWSGRRLWDRSVAGWRRWTAWDFNYCGKSVVATLFANQLGAVDILVAGILFPSAVVADYALAARIAALYSFLQLAVLKRFAPRAAAMVEANDSAALRQEFTLCRKLLVGCGALTITGILCVAPFLLPLFGNYAGAWRFVVWLAIPAFVQSFYETSDRLLIIAGQANLPLLLTASSFAVLVIMPFLTAPLLGPTAVPAAMAVSSLLFNPLLAARVRRAFGLRTIHPQDRLMMGAGIALLASYAITGAVVAGIASIAVLAVIAVQSVLPARVRKHNLFSARTKL